MATAAPSSLDPIFPLPAGTGIPPVKQGRGAELFENDVMVAAGMTYRSFYVMWEQVERRAAENYPKYVGGPMGHVADTWLEAVVWCRNIAFPNAVIEPISERKAQKIRTKEAEAAKALAKRKKPVREGDTGSRSAAPGEPPLECPKCGPNRTILKKKSRKTGKKIWKCADCEHTWPRRSPSGPSTRPSKGRGKAGGSQTPPKQKATSQKRSKKQKTNA